MAPVGILTAIVGAIRVDGTNWLKQLVGRARETTAGAEIELMSSVSQEVCEVWNGTSIVRSMGAPQVKQIIHLPAEDGDFSPESFITTDRKTWSKGYELKTRYWSTNDTGSEKLSTNEDNNVDIELAHADNNDVVQPLRNEELINNKEIPRIYRSISTARVIQSNCLYMLSLLLYYRLEFCYGHLTPRNINFLDQTPRWDSRCKLVELGSSRWV